MKFSYLVVLACCSLHQNGIVFNADLNKWFATNAPTRRTKVWNNAQNDMYVNWVVFLDKDSAHVRLANNSPTRDLDSLHIANLPNIATTRARQLVFKVKDGLIASFDNGEFGGELWWLSSDGSSKYKILDANVQQFVETKLGLFCLSGVPHGVAETGSLVKLELAETGKWVSSRFSELEDVPLSACPVSDNAILIVTSKGLISVDIKQKTKKVLVDDAFWYGLYPSSLVVDDQGVVFIGMRHGVVKIERSKAGEVEKLTWLLLNEATKD